MKNPDRPWLYPDHPEYQTFVQLMVAALSRGYERGDVVERATLVLDAVESIRNTGGVPKEQVPPKQPRVQPTDDPNQVRTFFRTPDGVTYIVGMMGNLEIKEGNSKIIIQRADLEEALNRILREFYGKKIIG